MNAIIYKTKNLDRKVSELHSWPPLQQDLINALFSSWNDAFQLLLDFNRKPKQFMFIYSSWPLRYIIHLNVHFGKLFKFISKIIFNKERSLVSI